MFLSKIGINVIKRPPDYQRKEVRRTPYPFEMNSGKMPTPGDKAFPQNNLVLRGPTALTKVV